MSVVKIKYCSSWFVTYDDAFSTIRGKHVVSPNSEFHEQDRGKQELRVEWMICLLYLYLMKLIRFCLQGRNVELI